MRTNVKAMALSAAGFISILAYEGYSSIAYQPVEGDVWTIGFGTTQGVKEGDQIDPVEAMQRANQDAERVQKRIRQCVKAGLTQGEFDAYTSLAYNIGTEAFCSSTLVKKVNEGDHVGACREILRWVYFKGKKLDGLVNRREREYRTCVGTDS